MRLDEYEFRQYIEIQHTQTKMNLILYWFE